MSFPAIDGSRPADLAEAWSRARGLARHVKITAVAFRAASVSSVPSGMVFNLAQTMADMKTALLVVAAVPGIAPYAQAQISDSTIDIVAEFNNMIAKMDAVTAWIVTNFPKDAGGFLLAQKFNNDNSGRVQDRSFSSAEVAPLGTVLDALIAAID